ncbi:MAG: methyltransferase [Nanoarchaeota archaeon]|nr:methyltransferase [Nanoarchaeota archaeon]
MIYPPLDDSMLLAEEVKKYCQGKTVLDMGTGSGIQAEKAFKNNAKSVTAVDINNESAKILQSKGIKFIQSDLFSNVQGEFDLLIFNPPYLPLDPREDGESSLATTGGKRGDELILRFLKQAQSHLTKKGLILLVVSSLTPKNLIKRLLRELGMKFEKLSEKKLFMEKLEVWKISKDF